MDTIFALASARGRAGVSVIRISGPDAPLITQICGSLPASHEIRLRNLTDRSGLLLDSALVAYFAEPQSFTGENVVELHLHGSIATINKILAELAALPGFRQAEPGEFTRRALDNGRMDLAQVEGLADLIDAETEAQRQQALNVLSGALGQKAEIWRSDLIRAAALLEATIDFVDEEVPVDVAPDVLSLIDSVTTALTSESKAALISERIRDGFEVAIIGAPNVGKSTLLNALAGRDAAITSSHAGTTRDVIEVRMDLNGLPVTILDTAGLRDTADEVEALGIQLAIDRAKSADLRVFLVDDDQAPTKLTPGKDDIVVRAKADTRALADGAVSGKTGQGVDDLVRKIADILSQRASGSGTAIRERHRLAMYKAVDALNIARDEVLSGSDRAELAAEELRVAIRTLDSLIGRVDVEDLLDEIFASFCLGK